MKYDFSKEEVQIHKDREGRNVQVKSIHTLKSPAMYAQFTLYNTLYIWYI